MTGTVAPLADLGAFQDNVIDVDDTFTGWKFVTGPKRERSHSKLLI